MKANAAYAAYAALGSQLIARFNEAEDEQTRNRWVDVMLFLSLRWNAQWQQLWKEENA